MCMDEIPKDFTSIKDTYYAALTLTSTLTADYVIVLLWNFVLFLLDTITYYICN